MFYVYFFVSVAALILDVSLASFFYYLTGTSTVYSVVIGYVAGAVVHYHLMRSVLGVKRSNFELFLYVVIGALGLLATHLVVFACMAWLFMSFFYAKCAAVLISFFLTYYARYLVIMFRWDQNLKGSGVASE